MVMGTSLLNATATITNWDEVFKTSNGFLLSVMLNKNNRKQETPTGGYLVEGPELACGVMVSKELVELWKKDGWI